jgi:predicted DNA-binding transcriptional regulator AlpA
VFGNDSTTSVPMEPVVPLNATWLDAEAAGRMIGYDARQFRERIACRPDFPKPTRIGGVGHPRWNAAEVNDWMHAERDKSRGRPRKNVS